MKSLVVFCMLLAVALANEHCYKSVVSACSPSSAGQATDELLNCNAKYSGIDALVYDLQAYTNEHISRNWEYLLMSVHFQNYEKNREGFAKLFKKYSDATWNSAIEMIKHIAKRGGQMNFNAMKTAANEKKDEKKTPEMSEMASLAHALDIQKTLANEAHNIHGQATRHGKAHDPEISQFLEEDFIEPQAGQVRELAGHVSDLKKLISNDKPSLNMFLFDQYLQTLYK